MKIIIVTFLTVLFCSCQDHKTQNVSTETCNLSDTLINKIPYGINKDDLFKHTSKLNNKYLLIAEYKLNIEYKSWFYHDSLFSLEIELTDSLHFAEYANNHKRTQKFDKTNYIDFEYETNVRYTSMSKYAGNKIVDVFTRKYGAPTSKMIDGKVGDLIINSNSPNNKMHFRITHTYEWKCNSKSIKIEYIEKSSIYKDSDQNVDKLLANKSYESGNYSEFKILYENLKHKTLFYKDSFDNNEIKLEKESKKKEELLKKQSENI